MGQDKHCGGGGGGGGGGEGGRRGGRGGRVNYNNGIIMD